MRLVIIESPYAGNIELNLRYLRACMADCLRRGEAPFASHALYTQPGVLRDEVPEERQAGIHAGFAWRERADATVVYTDLGTSRGMEYGIAAATRLVEGVVLHGVGPMDADGNPINHVIEYRTLGAPWVATNCSEAEAREEATENYDTLCWGEP